MNHLLHNRTTADWQAIDSAHFLHPFTDHKAHRSGPGSRIIVGGQGCWLTDSEGHRILDGMAGLWCVNVGYGRSELIEAATAQLATLPFYHGFFGTAVTPAIELAQLLAELAPPGIENVFFASSGSEAVDSALRIARHVQTLRGKPGKRVIIGRQYGYHGSTIASAAAGGITDMHRQAGSIDGVVQIMPPYRYAYGNGMDEDAFGRFAARKLEERILELGAENVAAFIGEPIQGAGGVIIPPRSYWPEIQRICREHDILLIVDEVICGFGRTGTWFGSGNYGIAPDIMTCAKGITSGYVPLSAVLLADGVVQTLSDVGGEFFHGFTNSGHPVACAVALANLRLMQEEDLVARANPAGAQLLARFRDLLADHPMVGEIRGEGLIGAIELTADRASGAFFPSAMGVGSRCRNHCFAANVIARSVRDTMVFAPPLSMTEAEIDILAERVATAIDRTYRELTF